MSVLAKFAGPWMYVAIVLASAAAGGWIVGGLKDRQISALRLSYAEAVTKQLTDIFEARTAFDEKQARANTLILSTLKDMATKRAADSVRLTQTLAQESQEDATLSACLSYRLSPELLREFP